MEDLALAVVRPLLAVGGESLLRRLASADAATGPRLGARGQIFKALEKKDERKNISSMHGFKVVAAGDGSCFSNATICKRDR